LSLTARLRQRLRSPATDREAWYRRRRIVLPAGVVAVYALCGFLLVPALVRHYVPQFLRDSLGLEASLGEVRFDPFRLRLDARDFALSEADGGKLAAFGRLFVDFELSSLFRWAWTFAELRLEDPEVAIVLEKDGRLNLQRVLGALPPAAEEPEDRDAEPPRVVLQRAAIEGARLRFSDLRGGEPASTVLGPLDLAAERIATLRERRGPYRIELALPGGARLAWQGELSLHPLASQGSLALEGFEPRAVWDFARERVRLAPPRGVVEASLHYDLALAGGALRLRADSVELAVRDLALQHGDASAPMLELQSVALHGGRFDLGERRLSAAEVRLGTGRVAAAIDAGGTLDWSLLLRDGAADAGAASASVPAGPGEPWRAEIAAVALEDIALAFRDQTRREPLSLSLALRTLGFALQGSFGAGAAQAQLAGGALDLAGIALAGGAGPEPLARVGRLAVEGAELDLGARRVALRRVSVEGVEAALERGADGSIRQLAGLAAAAAPAEPDAPAERAAGAPWSIAAGEVALSGIAARFTDRSTQPALDWATREGRITLRELQSTGGKPFALEAALPVVQGGEIALAGTALPDGSAADLALRIDRLALQPLAPLVAGRTTLELRSGALSADARIAVRKAAGQAAGLQATGTLDVEELLLREADGGDRLLSWRSLAARGIDFAVGGQDRLRVRELRLQEPGAKIVVLKDRSLNLATIVRAAPAVQDAGGAALAAAHVPAGPPPSSTAAGPARATEPFPVEIERVRIDGGTVDFADFSLVLPFAARIEQLKGGASGISSSTRSRATLAFRGRVGEFGEAEIDGQLAPFDPRAFTDIEVSFRNVAMSPFSPYSATFAGRKIESGDLDLDLGYEVDGGLLAGENRILLQDFRLGETVESPGALKLPLDLAIALLTDAQGRIDVAVPVSGNVGDPAFSYGHVIWQALGNLIRGVVTAPFRALDSLVGTEDAAAMQNVRFRSGSTELMPREQERIAKVAAALADRPQLGVRVPPGIEAGRDGYAVRRLALRRAVAAALGHELEPGEDPGPVSYENAKSQRALEQLLAAREGEDAPELFAAAWAKQQGREPERVNAALALLGKGSEDRDYYRALYLHLVGSTPEPVAELDAIARGRAEAVAAEFARRGVQPGRVTIGERVALEQARPAGVMLPLELVAGS